MWSRASVTGKICVTVYASVYFIVYNKLDFAQDSTQRLVDTSGDLSQ